MLHYLKTAFKRLILPGLIAVLLVPAAPRTGWSAPDDTGTITASALNVRSEPSRQARKIAVLKKGTRVTIHDEVDGWLKISYRRINGYILKEEEFIHIEAPSDTQLSQLKKKAEQLDQTIERHKSEIEQFNHQETEILETLNEIDLSYSALDKQVSVLSRKTDAIRDTIRENEQAARILEQKIAETGAYAANRLVGLYKLNLLGKMNVLGAADTVYDFLRTKKDLAIICDHDAQILSRHLQNQERLTAILNRLVAEEAEKASLEADMQRQIKAMNREKKKRQTILVNIREQESARRSALASLEKAARTLDQTIAALYENTKTDKRLKGAFSSLKGLLPMPVSGKIITEFGKFKDADFKIVNFRSGIDIAAERGEPVRAVFRGEVLFAQWFKGYGNMMIIDHGEKYYTVYAHAQELFKKQGDFVETSEVIATVGDTASISSGTALYFELRHQGKPVDPMTWLNTG